ncbi:Asp-tRNA(Asn)/Glu-tRNA(Gln) amidotransferase subunit GatA [Thermus thermophilus]|uniref:Glutamyl-tRNA(Gln) amidotransferase subunit A n=1 Tax=Thermus thermophilus (strain ATCC BAA-163 / DSM 7039 / HB27) TaxID=262724 RepID=GATA_THET2|nr:Asp-tRNA(Asn)/Glu-tRNA(Gln) amidotransferase subunit GatA [Thermus thermophilus]Q72L58.1 RecName: Full=Glutamyl-tRNA(Gln) amidotransferase subunit A; Short=Glu-ADT subunit A [Thermus thermophilus HB27]AAS80553.1 glutamyl-tRNA(Gln) amidotransferase subunit A [Thermus thermophilus HB27]QMV30264.1 Asp-tRNA(Asn)/Glu-tRNA(Gln) amidotransferase subunit GatA [Thermus thermophilus]WMV95609.1 Asp-tRNA(Asn)/Glu-tRNA(Gln) amidotransferase subunit GatA [Thermus thermophilus HB27]
MLAHEIRARVARGEVSPLEVAQAYLKRVQELDPGLGAFLSLNERLLEEAEAVDPGLPLAGLVVAVKDNIATRGLRTTAGSRLLENFVPPYEATAVARLKALGALVLGKTNLDEFGMGSSTEHSAFFPTKNPFDPDRVPGGSSGGSAAALAADLAPLALGSDTGGSVRQPAAFCGVYGLKPTYGRVSRFGLIAYASSLDQIGPMARSVRDLALLMDAVAGPDPLDATSLDLPPRFQEALEGPLPPLRLGVVREALAGNSPGVERALEEALKVFRELGLSVREVSWPSLPQALAAYYILAPAEASSNLARYDGTLYGRRAEGEEVEGMMEATRALFGLEVKRRVLVGTFVLSSGYYEAYYGRAQAFRRRLKAEAQALFREVDLLLLPTTPHPAFPFGARRDPLAMYREDLYTVGANLTGLPALSFPAGFEGHLPVGLQLLAPWGEDERLLRAALAFEEATARAHLKAPLGEAL